MWGNMGAGGGSCVCMGAGLNIDVDILAVTFSSNIFDDPVFNANN